MGLTALDVLTKALGCLGQTKAEGFSGHAHAPSRAPPVMGTFRGSVCTLGSPGFWD